MRFRAFVSALTVLVLAAAAADEPAPVLKRHPKVFRVGANPASLVLADLTGDGLPEIITANRGVLSDPSEEVPANDEVTILIAREGVDYEHGDQLETGFGPYDVEAVNMDGQKALDLVVASFHASRGRNLSIFRNLGERRFEPIHFTIPAETLTYKQHRYSDDSPLFTQPGITSIAVGRINQDEFRDVVATGWSSDVLIYFPGNAETYLGEPVIWSAPGGPRDVQLVDMDGDGMLDLVTTQYNSGEIAIWKGNGEGQFDNVKRFLSGGSLPHKVVVADINRDGILDIVVSHCFTEDNVTIWYGSGELNFDDMQKLELGTSRDELEHDIRDIVVADFNADGWLDIAAACHASRQVVLWVYQGTNRGRPVFRLETYPIKDGDGAPYALAAADVNADGVPDLGVALWETNLVTFFMSQAAPDNPE